MIVLSTLLGESKQHEMKTIERSQTPRSAAAAQRLPPGTTTDLGMERGEYHWDRSQP